MYPKKSLGQNFLNDKKILSKIVDVADINTNDNILEIGPGTGNLTEEIIKKNPSSITVVEKDNELSKLLIEKFGDKIKVINNDILNCYDHFKTDVPIKVFGNLPYNISTKILISYIKIGNLSKFYKNFYFIFQKEVADRIIANENSNNYGRISIFSSWKTDSYKILDISPDCFYPIPKVWSSLLIITPKLEYESEIESKNLEHITNIFFNQRRKMIKKPMKQLFKNYQQVAENLNLDLNQRPQNLSKNKYFEICKTYERLIS